MFFLLVRAMRYPNYSGEQGAWSIVELLDLSIVPNASVEQSEECFFRDVGSAAAHAAVKQKLIEIGHVIP